MPLNIKNQEAELLVERIIKETNESKTKAVIQALRERLERLTGSRKGPDLERSLLNIAKRCSQMPDLDQRPPDEIIGYNEQGFFGENNGN